MSLKLAMLLLFGFVALAVAVPLEDTEEKAEPAEPVASDAENPEAPLEESEADKSEDDNQKDAEEEPEADDNEDEPENEVEAKDEDGTDKRGRRRRYVYACKNFLQRRRCHPVRRSCHFRRYSRYGRFRVCRYVCRSSYVRVCQHCRRCRRGYSGLYCRRRRRYSYHRCRCRCGRYRG